MSLDTFWVSNSKEIAAKAILTQEFVAGRLAAGEMGNGVILEEMKPAEEKLREQMYQVALDNSRCLIMVINLS